MMFSCKKTCIHFVKSIVREYAYRMFYDSALFRSVDRLNSELQALLRGFLLHNTPGWHTIKYMELYGQQNRAS